MMVRSLVTLLVLISGGFALHNPYLFTSIEMSKASGQKDCNQQAAKVLHALAQAKRITVSDSNDHLARTQDSTIVVECIFTGPNEQKRSQWIFHVAIASSQEKEAQDLLKLLRSKFNSIVRID